MSLHIYRCEECDKSFPSEVILSWHCLSGCKLLQHLENLQVANSRITPKPWIPKQQATVGTWCMDCNRHFNTIGSLERHLKSAERHNPASAAHAFPYTTRPRVKSIAKYQPPHRTEIEPRPKSAKSNYCGDCNKQFKNAVGLEMHLKSARRHNPTAATRTSPRKTIPIRKNESTTEDLPVNPAHISKPAKKRKAQITPSKSAGRGPAPTTRKGLSKSESTTEVFAKYKSPYDKDARSIQNLFLGHQLCEKFPWYQHRRKLTKYKSRDDNAGAKKPGWRGMIDSRVVNKGGLYNKEEGWERLETAYWHIPGKKGKRKANRSRKAEHDKYGVMQTKEWEDEVWLEQE
ncbi:hypothetical protein BDD12DRAFT_809247 [Trichophaea hybrida]|nr:hypothetical protein BDD12DRAFT_809247 [Trichophaea hybrida]